MDFDHLDERLLRTKRGEKWRTYPEDVLPLWVADMDFPVAEPLQRLLQRTLETCDLGYPVNPTPAGLPSVFARRMRERFGWTVDPERVVVLTDVVQGLYVALSTLCEPGDAAVIQPPIYPPFLHCVRETSRRRIDNPLVRGPERYEIDFDALRASIDARTRLLLLCNPHNPSGRAFDRAELEAIARIALERDLVIVSDEIHADLVYPGAHHLPIATLAPEVERRTITLMSASKAFNIAGLRCAVAAFGSRQLQDRFCSIPRHVRGGLGTLGLAATEVAWTEGQPWLDEVLAYLDGNRRFLAEFLRERLPGTQMHLPEATYLAWVDCRELGLEPSPYELFLERARVALSPGRSFGTGYDSFVRINFATSRALLTEGLERMAKAVAER